MDSSYDLYYKFVQIHKKNSYKHESPNIMYEISYGLLCGLLCNLLYDLRCDLSYILSNSEDDTIYQINIFSIGFRFV